MNKNKKKKGFTLVELIAVIAIMGIVFSIIFQIFDIQTKIYKTEMETNDAQNSGRLCLNSISESIRLASAIPENDISISIPVLIGESKQIVKIIPSYSGGIPYQYIINSNKLYKYVNDTNFQLIASNVKNITVTKSDFIVAGYVINVEIINGDSIKTFTTSMSVREWR